MNALPGRGYLGIGEVLAQLRGEFPDISVSKIRFLETEGLIAPARSPSGYRRFSTADVDRLRFILAAQRDQYLPLRVIRERLADTEPSDGDGDRPLTRRELLAEAELSEALLTELETFGLLRRVGRTYGPDAVQVAKTAVALTAYGVEARHLRSVRAAAERETTMIESLVAPILRQRASGARELAARTAGELADLVLLLHSALVAETLAEAGLSPAEVTPAVSEPRAADTAGWQGAIGGVL
jgi:DNA-binding transcriptional MerR regulator